MNSQKWTFKAHSKTVASSELSKCEGTHTCCQCGLRFATSNQLVFHMREDHTSFVEQARHKIERNKNMADAPYPNTVAICPFCKQNCQTRKKLMRHLEIEHKDDEVEEEPEFKVIRLEGEQKAQLLNSLKTESSQSQNPAIQSFLDAIESRNTIASTSTVDGNIRVVDITQKSAGATSLKFPEKRYKCFWCDTSFRKRGKLMDHIDMFHKASKQQSEVEAELIHGTGTSAQTEDKLSHASSSAYLDVPRSISHGPPTVTPSFSDRKPMTAPPTVCTFKLLGSVRENTHRLSQDAELPDTNICKFYNGRYSNPLLESTKYRQPTQSTIEQMSGRNEAGYRSGQHNFSHLVSPLSPHELRPLHPTEIRPIHQFMFGPGTSGPARMPFYSAHPFMMPPHHEVLMNPRQLIMGQRSPPQQYLGGINMASMNLLHKPYSTDSPLDLTKTK